MADDANALLTAGHAQPVELGAVQQLGEDARYLVLDDTGTVVLNRNLKAILGKCLNGDL